MDHDEEAAQVVRTIVELAHNPGMSVVAEGVERETQLAPLALIGCDFAQGYLIARPLPAMDAEVAVATWPERAKELFIPNGIRRAVPVREMTTDPATAEPTVDFGQIAEG
jgi:predicted signal transduction protein with EAL and GGDEF domain